MLKMSTISNFMTTFGIVIRNAFKRVQTCLVLVHYFMKQTFEFQKFERGNRFCLDKTQCLHTISVNIILYIGVSKFRRVGMSRRHVTNFTKCLKVSTIWNFMTIFGIIIKNEFKRVQTYLVLVHYFMKETFKFQKFEKTLYCMWISVNVHAQVGR